MQVNLAHPVSPISDAISSKKKRGGYNCGRCGLPKKGHICNVTNSNPNPNPNPNPNIQTTPFNINNDNGLGFNDNNGIGNLSCYSVLPHQSSLMRQPSHLRRALSFDDVEDSTEVLHKKEHVEFDFDEDEGIDGGDLGDDFGLDLGSCGIESVDFGVDLGDGGSEKMYLWELLRRLPPQSLFAAAGVCREWREMSKMIWAAVEELRLRVPAKAPIGFVGSVLQKCTSLVRLSLIMERDVDSMTLACIAFSCPNLESLEISMSGAAVNRITGDDLARFVADRRCLSNLKLEGCSNIGGLVLSSTSLSKLFLSELSNLSKMVFNCPNLREISLDFSRLENDSTDLATMVGSLGRSSPCLQKVHIASIHLSNSVVLSLTAANLRGLRMLSLVLGSEITDASVAAIASVYSNLELLDLSGSSITDSGIGMICNVFPETLSRLLLAVCPNITSSGIQFAAAQLPLLELMDCGMSICDPNLGNEITQDHSDSELQRTPNTKLHLMYQKLIIKHSQLKKLSLWGCSGLDALYLNCPQLSDLNLNSCSNLHPESLLLQCSNLEKVHATGCEDLLVDAIQSQVCRNSSAQSNFSSKCLPDGSKRVRAHYISEEPSDYPKKRRKISEQTCAVIMN